MNLLLVEDDADFAATAAAALRGFDHRVTIAGDGRAALSAVACESFDAMILDRMLPHIDGLSVLERLRGGRATLPVIMLSARGQSDDKVDGLVAGADDYVVKPVDAAELNARLHALLRGRGFAQGGDDTLRAGDQVRVTLRDHTVLTVTDAERQQAARSATFSQQPVAGLPAAEQAALVRYAHFC